MTKEAVNLSNKDKFLYNDYIRKASQLSKSEELIKQIEALDLFHKAYSIYSGNEKVLKKINHLEVLKMNLFCSFKIILFSCFVLHFSYKEINK